MSARDVIAEAHKLLVWAADSFAAHAKSADHPEEHCAYLDSEKMYRKVADGISTLTSAGYTIDRKEEDWQPIETAPKDGTAILCGWFDDDGTTYAIAGWYEPGIADRRWYDQYDDVICPTHWMPLPNPPKQEPAHDPA